MMKTLHPRDVSGTLNTMVFQGSPHCKVCPELEVPKLALGHHGFLGRSPLPVQYLGYHGNLSIKWGDK